MAKIRIIITNDGSVALFYPRGTFEEGKEKIQKVLKKLDSEGIKFNKPLNEIIDDIEQHRHEDPEWEKEHAEQHAHHIHFDGTRH